MNNHKSVSQCVVKKNIQPLGETFYSHKLNRMVVTCKEAAEAKGVSLSSELKTLILETNNGICAVNLCGNKHLSLRSVKRFLNVKEARLLSVSELVDLGLFPGTVCPFLNPVWHMHQLLSAAVLDLIITTTNNGTLGSFFIFRPKLLLKIPSIQIGDFEQNLVDGDTAT